jgi:hypothetical protein
MSSNEDVTSSELSFFKEYEEVLQIIKYVTIGRLAQSDFISHFSLLTKILVQYQEQSQLLEPHLNQLVNPLADVMVNLACCQNFEV